MVPNDRRSKFRKRPLSLVYVELATGNGGMMRDLCEEGLALRAMMPVRPGEITSFNFNLEPGVRIEGEGRMIWVEEGGRVAGLEFTRLSADSLAHIQEWLQRGDDEPREEVPVAPAQRSSTLEDLKKEARTVASRPPSLRPEVPDLARPEPPRSTTPKPDSPRAGSRGDVRVFPAPPREIPTQEALKKEIAEALRQAAEERLAQTEEERPKKPAEETPPPKPVAAAPPPPAPADTPTHPAVAPVTVAAQQTSQAPAVPQWNAARFESLPAIEDLDFSRRQVRRSTGSRFLAIVLLAAAAFAVYQYRRQVGQAMIQAGQRISEMNEAAESTATATKPSLTTSREQTPSPEQGSHESANRPELELSPPASVLAPSGGSDGNAPLSGNSSSSGDQTQPGANASSSPPSYVSSAKPTPSSIIPVSPLVTGGKSASAFDGSSEAGQTEYAQAVQMLRASKDRATLAESARLLWIAVEKGNSNAEVALAELYRLGQGVGQNCDQARVLLTAAARKGNPEGVKHLQLFEQAGCE